MITIYLPDKTEAYTKEELFAKVEALQGEELDVKEVDYAVWKYLSLLGIDKASYESEGFSRSFSPVEVGRDEEEIEVEQLELF